MITRCNYLTTGARWNGVGGVKMGESLPSRHTKPRWRARRRPLMQPNACKNSYELLCRQQ
jgi:hypothetical protein